MQTEACLVVTLFPITNTFHTQFDFKREQAKNTFSTLPIV